MSSESFLRCRYHPYGGRYESNHCINEQEYHMHSSLRQPTSVNDTASITEDQERGSPGLRFLSECATNSLFFPPSCGWMRSSYGISRCLFFFRPTLYFDHSRPVTDLLLEHLRQQLVMAALSREPDWPNPLQHRWLYLRRPSFLVSSLTFCVLGFCPHDCYTPISTRPNCSDSHQSYRDH